MDHSLTKVFKSFSPAGIAEAIMKPAQTKAQSKASIAQQRETFSEQTALDMQAREKAAVEGLRKRIAEKLNQVAALADEAAGAIEAVRRATQDPALEGDPVLEEVDKNLADLEEGLVRIQTGTVADTGTFDTHVLAVSYADAQAAFVGMSALKARAVGLAAALRRRITAIKEGLVRAEALRVQQAAQAEQDARRQAELDREQQRRDALTQRRDAMAQEQRAHERAMAQLSSLDEQINEERRGLAGARLVLRKLRLSVR